MKRIVKNYQELALEYAEKYGKIEYSVKGPRMIYYENWPTEGCIKHIIDLRDMSHTSKKVRRNKKGNHNLY